MTGGSILKSKLFWIGVLYNYYGESFPLGVFYETLCKRNRDYLLCGTVSIYRDAWCPDHAPLTMEYEL